ncbi:hypothetical protein MPSEU_000763800 [Mayamaea pseudoterrestris]|nr:hypothetical protein MPSEU_000763800 [Mayamaea pseudoterrestris]
MSLDNGDHQQHQTPLRTLTEDVNSWNKASLLSVSQITAGGLQLLFQRSREMRRLVRENGGGNHLLQHKLLASVFYEASTRTACSFQSAMMRLGGNYLHVEGHYGGNSSAAKKGESLEDTIKCLECYVDVTVLRHPVQGSVEAVIHMANKPVINAGDGVGEHPTQALLDVFTIYDELKMHEAEQKRSHLVVVILGDLKHGRTVHSLAKLLCTSNIWQESLTLRYCSPDGLEMPPYVQHDCAQHEHVQQETIHHLRTAIEGADVLYVTRIQRERFDNLDDYEKANGSYVVDASLMENAPAEMVVLHPLPRVNEITTEVDADPRAAYFRQMENGMFVRMALLSLILGV